MRRMELRMDIHLLFRPDPTYLSIRKGICGCSRLNMTITGNKKKREIANDFCTYLYGDLSEETRERLHIMPFSPRQEDESLPAPCIECLCVLAEELENWRHGQPSHVYE